MLPQQPIPYQRRGFREYSKNPEGAAVKRKRRWDVLSMSDYWEVLAELDCNIDGEENYREGEREQP